jgi:IS5 family transposase
VLHGNTHGRWSASIFEPTTEVIRRGKAKQPTEFGRMIKVQEAEAQIITSYEVYEKRPSDSDLLVPAIEVHHERPGRVPRLVAGDAGFYSAQGEKTAHEMGVQRVSAQSLDQERGAKETAEDPLVQARTEVENRMRGSD